MITVDVDYVALLELEPHPEGGFYREYYRAPTQVVTPEGHRSAATSIYFLLDALSTSHLHRIKSDEIWCWHAGGIITLFMISPSGVLTQHKIGDPTQGASFTHVVPAGYWFGAFTNGESTLVTAVVAPGFDFADFELGSREALLTAFPQHADVVLRLTTA